MPPASRRRRRTARRLLAGAALMVVVASVGGCARHGTQQRAGSPSGVPGGVTGCPRTPNVTVNTGAALSAALAEVSPGETLELAPGRYVGTFSATVSGTRPAPITLCGSGAAVLDGGDVAHGYALHLDHASYWRLVGFRLTGAQKGLVLDASDHDEIVGITVDHVGDEGIHLRAGSSDDVVRRASISATGLLDPTYGEGVYVGSARSNWCSVSGCGPDRSDRDLLVDNRISETTAEAIDVKEGTSATAIRGNTLSAKGGVVDSVVDLKGDGAVVSGNAVTAIGRDGVQIHVVVPGWGARNRVGTNTFVLAGDATAVRVDGAAEHAGNMVSCAQRVHGSGWRGVVSSVRCG